MFHRNAGARRVLFLALITSGLLGCDPMAKPPSGRADLLPREQYGQIQASGTLDKFLLFDAPVVTDPEGDQVLEVEVPVRCNERYPISVQYRFEFYDRANRLLTRENRWVYLRMEPKLQYRMNGVGTHPSSADWRLIVRPAE